MLILPVNYKVNIPWGLKRHHFLRNNPLTLSSEFIFDLLKTIKRMTRTYIIHSFLRDKCNMSKQGAKKVKNT